MKQETNLYNVVSHIFNKKCEKKRGKNYRLSLSPLRGPAGPFGGLKISLSEEKMR